MLKTLGALAEPNRLRILELLRGGPQSVGRIGQAVSMRQPQVSKHLRVLREAGLVDVEAQAQQRVYQLRGAPLRELHEWLEDYRALWEERLAGLDAVIEELKERERGGRRAPRKPGKRRRP